MNMACRTGFEVVNNVETLWDWNSIVMTCRSAMQNYCCVFSNMIIMFPLFIILVMKLTLDQASRASLEVTPANGPQAMLVYEMRTWFGASVAFDKDRGEFRKRLLPRPSLLLSLPCLLSYHAN
jgi:hypothetical protein